MCASQRKVKVTCVSLEKLKDAYTLLRQFKEHRLLAGTEINNGQIELFRLLCADLIPTEEFAVERLESLILRIAKVDTVWNKKSQVTIDAIYALREAGKTKDAITRVSEFVAECPSVWYCNIVKSIH